MGTELFLGAVIVLLLFAIFDLVVGVSNDAVNFLNSSLGSKVAPRSVILGVASLGILAGVLFSSGMMEVARKGIFHPTLFTMPELMTIFVAVMVTDIILLDLFNTFGLPTSTTVSIVFELLGAAVAVSCLKISEAGQDLAQLGEYINSAKAMVIISGILLSVAISFVCGAIVQFFTRLIFTFDYEQRLRRYGALWGGVALTSITYFILVKGAKGSTFITKESLVWIMGNTPLILLSMFGVSALILRLIQVRGGSILKPIVIIGTFALALAFAANDLVNFIGVPLAGYHAYDAAMATDAPLTSAMGALAKKVQSEPNLLLAAGGIMIATLWMSRKARSVTETEIGLGQQEEGQERFGSTLLSRSIVRMALGLGESFSRIVPTPIRRLIERRMDTRAYAKGKKDGSTPSFDLLRASVNLMVASAVVSYATSQKLPLSTTYVTFMVAMGSSFADGAWGRESAVYRVTGVLTVIGGWFLTAIMAFTVAAIFALILWYGQVYGAAGLFCLAGFLMFRNHHQHRRLAQTKKDAAIFDLKRVTEPQNAAEGSFAQTSHLVDSLRQSLDNALKALFSNDEEALRREKRKAKQIQSWTNIIIANVFKAMRLVQKEDSGSSPGYATSIRRIQKLADGHRDIVLRACEHVANHHSGLLEAQIADLEELRGLLDEVLDTLARSFSGEDRHGYKTLVAKDLAMRELSKRLNEKQVARIVDGSSKTRLSVLHYAVIGNARMLSKQAVKLMEVFHDSFADVAETVDFDLD